MSPLGKAYQLLILWANESDENKEDSGQSLATKPESSEQPTDQPVTLEIVNDVQK